MITMRSAIAAMAAVAVLFSIGASRRESRAHAVAAKNAAKSGDGARLGASLAVLQKAAAAPGSAVRRHASR